MASVNFMKLHGNTAVAAILRHCKKDERTKHKHSNPDIDSSQTSENMEIFRNLATYEESFNKYKKRIDWLDSQPKANKRKDRVTAFSVYVPAAEGMTKTQAQDFFILVCKYFQSRFGGVNCVSASAHYDEVHQYLDDGQIKTSRPHMHFIFIPELGGKLNAREVSSRKNLLQIQKDVNNICVRNFGLAYNTGERPKHKTVEELKAAQEVLIAEALERSPEVQSYLNKSDFNKLLHVAELESQIDALKAQIATIPPEVIENYSKRSKKRPEASIGFER